MAATAPPGLFDQFAHRWRGYVLIALLALASALMGASGVPVTDIDEARFAQATRQMIETDDYVRIRLQDAERNRKPAGIHWLQAASVNMLSPDKLNAIWPYRLPSALGLMLASLATLWAGTVLVGARAGFIGAALFAVGLLAGVEGMLATTDAAMTGFTTLALAALAHLRVGARRPRVVAIVFWAALACGILIKGPATPLVAMLTLATLALWERRIAWMRPLAFWTGPALAVLIVLPWMLAIGAATDGRFFADFLAHEIWPKLVGGDRAHGGMPGYHTLLLPVLIFPATYALPAALRIGLGAIQTPPSNDAQAPYRFLIAWAAPTFAFFELMPAKLIHYTLPVYPAIALLCGVGLLLAARARWRTAHPAGVVIFAVSGAIIVAIMAMVSVFMPGALADAGLRRAIATALVGALTLGGATACLIFVRHPAARAGALVACSLIFSFSLRERLLPEARTLFVSSEAVAAMTRTRVQARDDEPFWVVGYEQPSIIFLTRTSVRLASSEVAGANAEAGDGMIVEGRALEEVQRTLETRGLAFAEAEPPVRGMALGRGERMALYVGRVGESVSGEASASQPPRP
ncbi:MAG: ArnT family glycosyltransferase [Hyphomonadaceae bacterium]